jgi:hypothetical protein
VEQVNSRREAIARPSARRFIRVAPPTAHAGIGEALRLAFHMDGELRSLKPFADLLARLQ